MTSDHTDSARRHRDHDRRGARRASLRDRRRLGRWRRDTLTGAAWFDEHAVNFGRHYTGSLACVPSRPTLFTGQYPDVHGVTQTDGLGKMADDSRMRWLPRGRGADARATGSAPPATTPTTTASGTSPTPTSTTRPDERLRTNDDDGVVDDAAVERYLDADPLDPYGFSGWVGPEPHGGALADTGVRRDPLIARRVVAWLEDRYARRRAGDADALRPFLLVASFVNPHDIVLFPLWARRGSPLTTPSPLDPPPMPAPPTADEDLATKPAAQIAYPRVRTRRATDRPLRSRALYDKNAQQYRDLYYRLHAEVDGPIDRVRRAVTDARIGARRDRAHLRPRRPARRPRRAAPEVVQPLRRGHPRSVLDRADRRRRRPPARSSTTRRRRTSTSCPRCSRAAGIDEAIAADGAARVVHRGPSAARDAT